MPQIFIVAWFTNAASVAHSRVSSSSQFTDLDTNQVRTFAWIRTWIRNQRRTGPISNADGGDPENVWTGFIESHSHSPVIGIGCLEARIQFA